MKESSYDRCVRQRVEPLIFDAENIAHVIDANHRIIEGEAQDGDELFETDGLPSEYDTLRAKQHALVMLTKHKPLTEAEEKLHQSVEVQIARAEIVFRNTPLLFKDR